MRGTMIAKGNDRMVWSDGTEQELASPNSDELWDWMTDQITSYAKISVECPALIGVFLDYENYSPEARGNGYDLSYDDKIMGEFSQATKVEIPDLPFAERAQWLRDHKLYDKFQAFQIKHWRARCRKLREAVDAINPTFQFCVYPAPGTLHMTEAAFVEWGTKAAPVIWADPSIYGRPAGLVPHQQALETNRTLLQYNMKVARSKHVPFMYAGGLDPVVRGADPEFTGRNAAMSAPPMRPPIRSTSVGSAGPIAPSTRATSAVGPSSPARRPIRAMPRPSRSRRRCHRWACSTTATSCAT
jgi:hypothetical protein